MTLERKSGVWSYYIVRCESWFVPAGQYFYDVHDTRSDPKYLLRDTVAQDGAAPHDLPPRRAGVGGKRVLELSSVVPFRAELTFGLAECVLYGKGCDKLHG